jgi:hypothetical protein
MLRRAVLQPDLGTMPVIVLVRLSMTDFIASDDDGRWDADRAALFAETERRSWENHGDRWPEAKDDPDSAASYRQRTTATASWQRSVLIIAALSALAWAGVTLVVIVALSAL